MRIIRGVSKPRPVVEMPNPPRDWATKWNDARRSARPNIHYETIQLETREVTARGPSLAEAGWELLDGPPDDAVSRAYGLRGGYHLGGAIDDANFLPMRDEHEPVVSSPSGAPVFGQPRVRRERGRRTYGNGTPPRTPSVAQRRAAGYLPASEPAPQSAPAPVAPMVYGRARLEAAQPNRQQVARAPTLHNIPQFSDYRDHSLAAIALAFNLVGTTNNLAQRAQRSMCGNCTHAIDTNIVAQTVIARIDIKRCEARIIFVDTRMLSCESYVSKE